MSKLYFTSALLADGWRDNVLITVEGTRIAAIAADMPPGDATRVAGIAVPGAANVHSHAFQRGMAGLTEQGGPAADTFWTWRAVMYHFLSVLGPEDVRAIAAQLYVEMLETGFTSVGEFHYLHHDVDGRPYADPAEMAGQTVEAARESGIGLTLLPVFYAHGGLGGAPPLPGQRRFITGLDDFQRLVEHSRANLARQPEARLGIAPHSLRAVTPAELAHVAGMEPGAPLHIHAAEQTKEVEDCLAWSGMRPVEWLLRHAEVSERWCLIHATHMLPAETEGLAKSGAVAGLCPITESNLGDGTFDGVRFRSFGGRFGLGSDSAVRVSLNEEMRTLEYSQRLRDRARNTLAGEGQSTARIMFDTVCAAGARALMRETGVLCVGALADIVVLDSTHPALAGRTGDQVLNAWVFGAGDGVVRDVWAQGRHVVQEGRHVMRGEIARRFAKVMARVVKAL